MNIFHSFTSEVVRLLKNGGVGVIPTDTVYGVVAPLSNQAAVERIYELKGRDPDKPVGTILINDAEQIEDYVAPEQLLPAQVYWPGPVSVVLPVGDKLNYAHRGLQSLPFRIPDYPALRRLLAATGPLASSSANSAGKPTATTIEEAMGIFREAVDFYVDGGDFSGRPPSKIITFNNGEVAVLRGGNQ